MESVDKFKPINIFAELLPFFSCNCEKMMDDMVGRWHCPVHGKRQPNYDAIFEAERLEEQERRINEAEFRRDELRDEKMMRSIRHPADFDEHPSNEQMEYFKRGGR